MITANRLKIQLFSYDCFSCVEKTDVLKGKARTFLCRNQLIWGGPERCCMWFFGNFSKSLIYCLLHILERFHKKNGKMHFHSASHWPATHRVKWKVRVWVREWSHHWTPHLPICCTQAHLITRLRIEAFGFIFVQVPWVSTGWSKVLDFVFISEAFGWIWLQ